MKLIYALLIMIMSFVAPVAAEDDQETCVALANWSFTIMHARQTGTPIERAIEVYHENAQGEYNDMFGIITPIVIEQSYNLRQLDNEEDIFYAAESAGNAVYEACMVHYDF